MFSLIWAWINGWVNNREAGDLRRHSAYYEVIVMNWYIWPHLYSHLILHHIHLKIRLTKKRNQLQEFIARTIPGSILYYIGVAWMSFWVSFCWSLERVSTHDGGSFTGGEFWAWLSWHVFVFFSERIPNKRLYFFRFSSCYICRFYIQGPVY